MMVTKQIQGFPILQMGNAERKKSDTFIFLMSSLLIKDFLALKCQRIFIQICSPSSAINESVCESLLKEK